MRYIDSRYLNTPLRGLLYTPKGERMGERSLVGTSKVNEDEET